MKIVSIKCNSLSAFYGALACSRGKQVSRANLPSLLKNNSAYNGRIVMHYSLLGTLIKGF